MAKPALDLTDGLWGSLRPEDFALTPEQQAELDRRLDALDRDGPVGIPWETGPRPDVTTQAVTRVLFRNEAHADVLDAFAFYEERQVGLGERFRDHLDVAIAAIARGPEHAQQNPAIWKVRALSSDPG